MFILPKIIHKNLGSGEPRTRAPGVAPEATLDLSTSRVRLFVSVQANVARTHVSARDYTVSRCVYKTNTSPLTAEATE